MNINFTAHSVSLMVRVFKAIGYADFISEIENVDDFKKNEELQKAELKKLMRLIFERAGYAEREINAFLSEVTGINDLEKLDYKKYTEIRSAVFKHEDFKDFFMSAQLSVVEMFSALQ